MAAPKIFIVHLRQPKSSKDRRDDPFWEFGSFGCTGCHATLLKHVYKGSRLAFAQGGAEGTKLVFLSPPLEERRQFKFKDKSGREKDGFEVKWKPHGMPFCYEKAPLLSDQTEKSKFPQLKELLNDVNRATGPAKFGSKFRSSAQALDKNCAPEIKTVYKSYRQKEDMLAETYLDAIQGGKTWRNNMEKCARPECRQKAYRGIGRTDEKGNKGCGKRSC